MTTLEEEEVEIRLKVPKWAIGGNIFVIVNKELLAYTFFGRKKTASGIQEGYVPLKIKTERCNGCGYCCTNLGSPFSRKLFEEILKRLQEYEFQDVGQCPLLGDNGCILGKCIPLSCAVSDCSRFPGCTESFKIGGNSSAF